MAASLTLRGVSKSGSPCDRLMMFLPSAIIFRATVEMAMVRLGWIRSSRSAVSDMAESHEIGAGPYRSDETRATGGGCGAGAIAFGGWGAGLTLRGGMRRGGS